MLWAVEATSSLLAGKFRFGRNCWSWPRSRLLRSPGLLLVHKLLLDTLPDLVPHPSEDPEPLLLRPLGSRGVL